MQSILTEFANRDEMVKRAVQRLREIVIMSSRDLKHTFFSSVDYTVLAPVMETGGQMASDLLEYEEEGTLQRMPLAMAATLDQHTGTLVTALGAMWTQLGATHPDANARDNVATNVMHAYNAWTSSAPNVIAFLATISPRVRARVDMADDHLTKMAA